MHALVIVDMQQGSIANSDKHDVEGIVERINLLSQQVRKVGGPVVFIAHDGNESENLLPHSDGWQILNSLTKLEGDIVIRKRANDAFYQTQLANTLEQQQISKLIICGWATDFCVDTTVKSALTRDYNVTVAADCHTVSDREFITADQVIAYHNWLWANMIETNGVIQVKNSREITLDSC